MLKDIIKICICFMLFIYAYNMYFDSDTSSEKKTTSKAKTANNLEISYLDKLPEMHIESASFSRYIYSYYHSPVSLSFKEKKDPSQESGDEEFIYWNMILDSDGQISLSKSKDSKQAKFLFVPSLYPDIGEKTCISILYIDAFDSYLSLEEGKLIVSSYKNDDKFKKNSSFCFFPRYEEIYKDTSDLFIKPLSDHNKYLSSAIKDSQNMFSVSGVSLVDQAEDQRITNKIINVNAMKNSESFHSFSYRLPDSSFQFYSYNKQLSLFQNLKPNAFDKLLFQPISIKAIRLLSNKKLDTKQIKDSKFKLKREYDEITTSTKNSSDLVFIMVPALGSDYDPNKVCASFMSLNMPGKFLYDFERKLALGNSDSKDFKNKATFCLEKIDDNYLFITNHDGSMYLNHHSMNDTYFYLMKDKYGEQVKSAYTLQKNFTFPTSMRYQYNSPHYKKILTFQFDENKELYIQNKKSYSNDKFEIQVVSEKMSSRISSLKCELVNLKYKLYLKSINQSSNGVFRFEVDDSDKEKKLSMDCSASYGRGKVYFSCSEINYEIDLEHECSFSYTDADGNEHYFEKNTWKDVDFKSLSLKKISQKQKHDQSLRMIDINLLSNKNTSLNDIQSCYLESFGKKYSLFKKKNNGSKFILSFNLPEENINRIADLSCIFISKNNSLQKDKKRLRCSVDTVDNFEILADDCRS